MTLKGTLPPSGKPAPSDLANILTTAHIRLSPWHPRLVEKESSLVGTAAPVPMEAVGHPLTTWPHWAGPCCMACEGRCCSGPEMAQADHPIRMGRKSGVHAVAQAREGGHPEGEVEA